ncbi:hypothetical protein HELRODRAFT_69972 [Helobdella robusta]|uniref:D-aminoacyl-tRNA deacylase n=1 Tax=Helobdella robusta TaxID=6412 RepID=T1G008_HELRO|nr:hypothetical protein HELRODRAFT_69972 [Helobdella robusta]ESN91658.1 hypothetical protein HELRODRAFT_69972 [Helobdella robusta]
MSAPANNNTSFNNKGSTSGCSSSSSNNSHARLLIQQCLAAKLKNETPEATIELEIGRGMVVYVCFKQGADGNTVLKLVDAIMSLRLSTSDDGELVTVVDLPGDILIVPQACLGGKVKGKSVQYHSNINKEEGERLYKEFIQTCKNKFTPEAPNNKLVAGIYGARQVLSMDTNGPYSHVVDL